MCSHKPMACPCLKDNEGEYRLRSFASETSNYRHLLDVKLLFRVASCSVALDLNNLKGVVHAKF